MKVLFAGTSGVAKREALAALQATAESMGERIFTERDERTGEEAIPILERQLYRGKAITFLELPEPDQRHKWRQAFAHQRRQFDKNEREHHFLGLHLTNRYERIPRCIVHFGDLVAWRPDCIVTFIDDAYFVRERVHRGGYRSFSLDELVLWRAEELMVGDILASIIDPEQPPPNYVIPVKYPATMLAKLLFGRQMARVYTSYGITDLRAKPELRAELNGFRIKMRTQANCAVFDPLSMDELTPGMMNASGESIGYDPNDPDFHWGVLRSERLLAPGDDLSFPISIPRDEFTRAHRALHAQIDHRDIRLVDQSHLVLVYRPTMAGNRSLSSGVHAEIAHAQHMGQRVIWYLKRGVDPALTSPFTPTNPDENPDFIYEESEDRLWQIVERLHASLDHERDNFLAGRE